MGTLAFEAEPLLPFTAVVFQFQSAPQTILARLALVCAACLGCPQLLDDDFALVLHVSQDGSDAGLACEAAFCEGPGAGSGGATIGEAGSGGLSGTGGQTNPGGAAGTAGGAGGDGDGGESPMEVGGAGGVAGASAEGGNAGASGSAGSGSSGGAAGAGPTVPECWQVRLSGDRHSASENCLGIHGWNAIETNPGTPATDVDVSYEDGSVCFAGSVAASGEWGAVYNLTFANTSAWNAEQRGVSGFSFEMQGPLLPPKLQVTYSDTDPGDDCKVVVPSSEFSVRFDATHPNCTTQNPGSSVPDESELTHLRLHFPVSNSAYLLDFCLTLRAIE